MRCIDADPVCKELQGKNAMLDYAIYCINRQPTVDVVEVVRCKDCLFGHQCFQVINGISDSWVECQNPDGLNRTVSDDGFCSASIKRREDDKGRSSFKT